MTWISDFLSGILIAKKYHYSDVQYLDPHCQTIKTFFSSSLFVANKKGFPVLPKTVQTVIRHFIDLKIQFIVEGRNGDTNVKCYQQYLDHVVQQHFVADPVIFFTQ